MNNTMAGKIQYDNNKEDIITSLVYIYIIITLSEQHTRIYEKQEWFIELLYFVYRFNIHRHP